MTTPLDRLRESVRIKRDMAIPDDMAIGQGMRSRDMVVVLALVEAVEMFRDDYNHSDQDALLESVPRVLACLNAITSDGGQG